MKIVVTGATGYVGERLVNALMADGDTVTVLTRDRDRAARMFEKAEAVEANLYELGEWTASLAGAHAIVHLAGELIAGKRWNAQRKQAIRDSRVVTTARIVDAIAALTPAQRPAALINASAIDHYAFARTDDDERDVTEQDPAGDGFLAQTCREWEAEARRAEPLGVRVAVMRTGLILGRGSAVLSKMVPQFKWLAGGPLGSGRQWVSWVHIDDVVAAFRTAIRDDRYRGPINVVAPQPVRQRQFASALGTALHRPSFMPTPAFMVKLAVGELAPYALEGRKVVPRELERLGFTFSQPMLDGALRDALAR